MNGAGVHISPQPAHSLHLSPFYREFSHWCPVGTSYPYGIRSTGHTDKYLGACRYVNTPTGANKLFEVVEQLVVSPDASSNMFGAPIVFAMVLNAANGNAAIAGECLQGIEIGSFNQPTPWATNYTFSPAPVLQLRYNFTLTRWEVLVFDAGGDAPVVYACDYQPGFAVDLGIIEAKLQWLPSTTGDSVLNAYLGGRLAKSVSGGILNGLISSTPFACGYFITNGSSAGANWTEAGFYGGKVYAPYTPQV